MSEEKEIVEEEEQKPMEQLRELRQQYPEINEVIISKNTISKILSNIYTSSNFSEKSEGVIFGRLTESQIIISSLFPTPISENPNNNLSNYLDTSRLDSTKLGFYLSNPGDEFQKIFPNCVILMIDTNAIKTNNYPFKCFRISEKLMEKFEEEEIEENIYLDKSNVVKEFYKQMFKKLNPNMNMIHLLNLKVGNDLMNLFEDLAEKKFLDEPENDMENNYFFNKGVNNNLNKKIKELNKGCEKLIEEQKKYIHFYKNKKLHNDIAFINNDNNKGIKNLGNTGEETFELFDLGLRSQNLKEINQSLKNILNRKEIDSYVACNLTK